MGALGVADWQAQGSQWMPGSLCPEHSRVTLVPTALFWRHQNQPLPSAHPALHISQVLLGA